MRKLDYLIGTGGIMRKLHYLIGTMLMVIALQICVIVYMYRSDIVADKDNFIVSRVQLTKDNGCQYTMSIKDGDKLRDQFKMRLSCGRYAAGDDILLIKGLSSASEKIKKEKKS